MEKRAAIIVGATGLVGKHCLDLLLENKNYSSVKIFARKKINIQHDKLQQHIIDFSNYASYLEQVKADDIFCCLGTTIRRAGSKKAFWEVDYTYPLEFAKAGIKNGVKQFILVSALGADRNSSNFYLKVKGEVEQDVAALGYSSVINMRPSLLLGHRNEVRPAEILGKIIIRPLSLFLWGPLKKYRGIKTKTVAAAMVKSALGNNMGVITIQSDKIAQLGK